MSAIRDTSAAGHLSSEAVLAEYSSETVLAEYSPEAVLAESAMVPSILKTSDTRLIAIGFGVFAILLILVTCL